jgi:hypothetical protein
MQQSGTSNNLLSDTSVDDKLVDLKRSGEQGGVCDENFKPRTALHEGMLGVLILVHFAIIVFGFFGLTFSSLLMMLILEQLNIVPSSPSLQVGGTMLIVMAVFWWMQSRITKERVKPEKRWCFLRERALFFATVYMSAVSFSVMWFVHYYLPFVFVQCVLKGWVSKSHWPWVEPALSVLAVVLGVVGAWLVYRRWRRWDLAYQKRNSR